MQQKYSNIFLNIYTGFYFLELLNSRSLQTKLRNFEVHFKRKWIRGEYLGTHIPLFFSSKLWSQIIVARESDGPQIGLIFEKKREFETSCAKCAMVS